MQMTSEEAVLFQWVYLDGSSTLQDSPSVPESMEPPGLYFHPLDTYDIYQGNSHTRWSFSQDLPLSAYPQVG